MVALHKAFSVKSVNGYSFAFAPHAQQHRPSLPSFHPVKAREHLPNDQSSLFWMHPALSFNFRFASFALRESPIFLLLLNFIPSSRKVGISPVENYFLAESRVRDVLLPDYGSRSLSTSHVLWLYYMLFNYIHVDDNVIKSILLGIESGGKFQGEVWKRKMLGRPLHPSS